MKSVRWIPAMIAALGVMAMGCGGGATETPGGTAKDPAAAGADKEKGYGYEMLPDKMNATDKSPPPPAGTSNPPIAGRLAPEEIQKVVRGNFDKLRGCYEEALKKDPKVAGKVVVRFVIRTDGTVDGAKDEGSAFSDPAMIQCSVGVIAALKFPPPEGGIVTVVYPIEFSP